MPVCFRVSGHLLSDDQIDSLSRSIVQDAADERIDLNLAPSDKISQSVGSRGDPFTIGTLVLALVTSGSIVALFNLLKSYAERPEELSVEFTQKTGTPVKLSMKNMTLEKFQAVVREFEQDNA